ncbi:MAG: patatin-like phospholipase family protein [Yoonia sp.]|uniref:patatin-like phospholipase family protein n=1 Tax=Yoonia sp. TaxID=2212373 RepID=UPI003EF285A6
MTTFVPIDQRDAFQVAPLENNQASEFVPQRSVKYLCFEGGGGKGVVFLGVVKALMARGVLQFRGGRLVTGQQVEGIAGSSAGALTAVMLSCGLDYNQIRALIFGSYNFNRFFDQPHNPAERPGLRGCVRDGHGANLPFVLRQLTRVPISGSADDTLRAKLGSARLVHYLLNFGLHMGIFSGCEAHRFFDALIAQSAARLHRDRDWRVHRNMTFAQHYEIFRVRLVLTGSNFETGKSEFFSADTSPNMPVATAARISMSLPLIFKPVVISPTEARQIAARSRDPRNMTASDLEGLWVDGGYMNNLPQTAFQHRPNGRRHTLGFTLNEYGRQRRRIRSLPSFLAAYAQLGVFGTGESQDSGSTGVRDDRVALFAGDAQFQIDTTDFAFTPAQRPHVDRLIRAAEQAVYRYFDQPR